jgi:hypothetical protein
MGEKIYAYAVLVRNLKETTWKIGVDGRIILKWILKM